MTKKQQWRQAIEEAMTPERMHAVMLAVIKAAVKGNIAAARLALEYTLGKPKIVVDMSGEVTVQSVELMFPLAPGEDPATLQAAGHIPLDQIGAPPPSNGNAHALGTNGHGHSKGNGTIPPQSGAAGVPPE